MISCDMKSLIFLNFFLFLLDELLIRIVRFIFWVVVLYFGIDGVLGEMVVIIVVKDKGNKILGLI